MRQLMMVALALLLPLPALSAEGFGLDLTEEPKKEEQPKPEEPRKKEPASAPLPVPATEAKKVEPRLSEAEITSEDRVKSVQRKAVLKRGRLELTPLAFITINDAFYPKFGPGGRVAFFFQDNLGLSLRAQQYNLLPNDNVRLAKRELQSKLPKVLPKTSVGLEVLWSPIYGKVAFLNSIKTFDLYVAAGVGAVFSQTSFDAGDGPHLSTQVGIGQRFAVNDWMAVDVSAIETLYTDRPDALSKSVLQHALALSAGVSFFVPIAFVPGALT